MFNSQIPTHAEGGVFSPCLLVLVGCDPLIPIVFISVSPSDSGVNIWPCGELVGECLIFPPPFFDSAVFGDR